MCGARAGSGAGRLLRSRPWMLPTVVVSVLALIGGTALAWTQGWMGVPDVGRILSGVAGSDDGGEGAGPHRFTPSDLSAGYRNGADVAWRIDTDNIQFKALSADHTVMFAEDYEKSYLYDISGAEPREVWSGDCGISAELWGNNLMCSVEGEGGVMVTSYQMVDGATGSVTPLAWTENLVLHCVAGDVGIFTNAEHPANMDEMEGRSVDGSLLWSVGDEGDGTYSSMAGCASDAPIVIALTGSRFEENVVIPRDGKSEDSPALALLDSRTGAILTYGDKFQVEPLANGEVAIDVSYDSAPDRGTLSVFDSQGEKLWSEEGNWLLSVQADISSEELHDSLPKMSENEWDLNIVGPDGDVHVLDYDCRSEWKPCEAVLEGASFDGHAISGPGTGISAYPHPTSFFLLSDGKTVLGYWRGEENAENSALAAYDMETGEETMHYNLWARYLSLAPVREDLIIAVPSALGSGGSITAIRPR